MKIQMRGRWGCGCSMAECDLRQHSATTYAGLLVLTLACRTHGRVAQAMLGLDADTTDGLDAAVTRRMNLMHEEDCR